MTSNTVVSTYSFSRLTNEPYYHSTFWKWKRLLKIFKIMFYFLILFLSSVLSKFQFLRNFSCRIYWSNSYYWYRQKYIHKIQVFCLNFINLITYLYCQLSREEQTYIAQIIIFFYCYLSFIYFLGQYCVLCFLSTLLNIIVVN